MQKDFLPKVELIGLESGIATAIKGLDSLENPVGIPSILDHKLVLVY